MINVTVTGRIIPNTANSDKNYVYTPATGDPATGGKPSWLRFLMSVRQEGAPKDPQTGFYPTYLLPCRAFGETADQIHQYATPGGQFGAVGVLLKDNNYVGKDGLQHEGGLYLKVQRIIYECLDKKENSGAPRTATGSTPATATGGIKVNHRVTNASKLSKPAASGIGDPF